MSKVFLDVGAYGGETSEEIVKPGYLFDVIHCFEPMPEAFARLGRAVRSWGAAPDPQDPDRFRLAGKTLILNPFGLADTPGERTLHGYGARASLYDGVRQRPGLEIDRSAATACRFVEASEYFRRNLAGDDLIAMKMNCEGAEVEILENLLASREIFKIDRVMIDFDAFKIKGMRNRPGKLLKRFRQQGFGNYDLRFEVMRGGSHGENLHNWLRGSPLAAAVIKNPRPLEFHLRLKRWAARHIKRPAKLIETRFMP